MISIYEPAKAVAKLTKSAKFKPDTSYVMSPQVVQQHINEGVLLYHTLVGALFLLGVFMEQWQRNARRELVITDLDSLAPEFSRLRLLASGHKKFTIQP